MLVTRAHKTALDRNNAQVPACRKQAGAARWAYNWGLHRQEEGYRETGTSPSAVDLQRELHALKQAAVPWMYAVSKCAPQEALRHLDQAFAHFFRRCQLKREGNLNGKLGYPQRKTKQRGLGSFRLSGSIVVFPEAIPLPRRGRVRLKEQGYLPTTVSEHTGGQGALRDRLRTRRALVRLGAGGAGAGSAGAHGTSGGGGPGR